MFDKLIHIDKEVLIFLNNLGNEHWDSFWLFITKPVDWAPFFLLILYLIFKKFGFKKGGFIFLTIVVMVAFSDQFTNLIRGIFQRLRPNNDLEINQLLRTLIHPQSYSFTSGHATTSTAFAVFIYLLFKKHYKYIKFIFIFPLIFAYSRLYLGVHFPIDILTGAFIGTGIGFAFYNLQRFLSNRFFT